MRTLCFVFNDKGELLLLKRSDDKFDGGIFNMLGGHIEQGEDIIDSANREIAEESAIVPDTTVISGIVHVTNFFGKNILMFITKSTTTNHQFIDSAEGTLQWVNIHDIDQYTVYADIKPFLHKIITEDKKFIGTSLFDGQGTLVELHLKDLD